MNSAVVLAEKPSYRRQWYDWAGCAISLILAAVLFRRISQAGLLILPPLLHQFLIGAAFLIRRPLAGRIRGLLPRAVAYGCTYLMPLFVALARRWSPGALDLNSHMAVRWLGLGLWAAGCLLELWGIWTLRYSFSIEPQARRLQTAGPYRIARHPIYLAYLLEYSGALFIFPQPAFAAVVAAWIAIMLLRVHYEEAVLRRAFPEYAGYADRVGALGPWARSHKTHYSGEVSRATRAAASPAARTVCE